MVDGSADSANILANLLRAAGYIVAVACDGPSGLDLLGAFRPDIALLDTDLPGLDGFEMARVIRTTEPFAAMPLVSMSANASASVRARARESGFDHQFSKPPDWVELKRVLETSSHDLIEDA